MSSYHNDRRRLSQGSLLLAPSSPTPRSPLATNHRDQPLPSQPSGNNMSFSTSFVREQSLALGNLERRQSFDSPSSSPSWATVSASTPSSVLYQSSSYIRAQQMMQPQHQQQQHQQQPQSQQQPTSPTAATAAALPTSSSLSIAARPANQVDSQARDPADKSPPSGLSKLLKGKPSNATESTSLSSSTATPSQQQQPDGQQNVPSVIASSSGTAVQQTNQDGLQKKGLLQRRQENSRSSPSPPPIDTTTPTSSAPSSTSSVVARQSSQYAPHQVPQRRTSQRDRPLKTAPDRAGTLGSLEDGLDEGDEYDDAAIEHMIQSTAKKSGLIQGFLQRLPLPRTYSKPGSGQEGGETDRLLDTRAGHNGGQYQSTATSGHPHGHHGHRDDGYEDSLSNYWRDFRHTPITSKVLIQKCVVEPVSYIPAVILGLLLNLLDAVSYGMIIFPLNMSPFQKLGPDGISMFFVSCVISQLVYSLGGSAFKGGNGSMMIEVVPFLHLMAGTVVDRLGAENREEVIATTIMAYALSTIMTGAVFLALGAFQLGSLIAFFPRHILVGCIGGVGWFLIITGLEVSSRMTHELTYTWETFKFLFLDLHVFLLWSSAFGLALLLRALQHKIHHPFLVPVFFMVVPGIFYMAVWLAGLDWAMLRDQGWVFPMPEGDAPGWQFYTYFSLSKTDWPSVMDTVPAMLALTFFGILHVPINVPALGVSTGQDDIDTNRELKAHGWSNLLSGMAGTVQNYLVYTNSLLFIKSGGDSRVAGVMLAIASFVVFLIGPWIVGYIPVMVVGSLIFHLGLDLVKEAIWDTWGLVHPLEYLTIALIVVVMAGFGFVEGIFFGILLACVLFVVTNSRKEGVRYACSGEGAKSTVRRVYRQQKFLRNVGRQIYIFKLQGDMFFGTINKVEKEIRDVFSRRRWEIQPIQFLVLDFSLVRNVDFSAAEGFGRIRRAVRAKGVCLVLSGLDEDGEVGRALKMVGVWGAGAGAGMGEGHGHGQGFEQDGFDTHAFDNLSEALEFCENCLLASYYRTRDAALEAARRKQWMEHQQPQGQVESSNYLHPNQIYNNRNQYHDQLPSNAALSAGDSDSVMSPDSEATHYFTEHMQHSPRKSHLLEAARDTLLNHGRERKMPRPMNLQQPVPTLITAFHDTRENPTDFYLKLSLYFERQTVLVGKILWRQGGGSEDGLYLVEEGTLRNVQEFHDNGQVRKSEEVVLPGTITGEMGLFTGNARSSTLVAETDCILWKLNQAQFQKMIREDPTVAVEFMRVAMSYSDERLNTLAAYAFNLS
ncbi:hypothetical protein BGW42_002268 [Actinomortierella wolfii]|nr:hypothetical protein BGW42_002268 [Actinomortierella wolfii]